MPALPSSAESDAALRRRLEAPPKLDLVAHMQAALAEYGDIEAAMLAEIRALSQGPGNLTAEEYFYYRLYDPSLALDEKRRFVGKRVQARIHAACNDPRWSDLVHDKLRFQERMAARGFPLPPLQASYRGDHRVSGIRHLDSREEVLAFLRHEAAYPCFAKPVDGMFSLGAYSIGAYDAVPDDLILAGGERVAPEDLVDVIEASDYAGYLFQDRLRPHRDLASLVGDRIATLRFVVILAADGPEIFRALCKIPVGENIADNFWRAGNMLGAIDAASGRILRVVSGTGMNLSLPTHHPDTQAPLIDAPIPLWHEAAALCHAAAAAFPGIRTQSWDVAVTNEGPVIVEANFGGDFNLPQLAFGRGVLDARLIAHLEACAASRAA